MKFMRFRVADRPHVWNMINEKGELVDPTRTRGIKYSDTRVVAFSTSPRARFPSIPLSDVFEDHSRAVGVVPWDDTVGRWDAREDSEAEAIIVEAIFEEKYLKPGDEPEPIIRVNGDGKPRRVSDKELHEILATK